MKRLPKQAGFTLIELVVVIVILGILAVTAAPKFIDLSGDANGATLQAVKAAVETATTGVHAKSLIAGNHKAAKGDGETVSVNGIDIEIGSGWPDATAQNFTDLLDIVVDTDFSLTVVDELLYIYITGDDAPVSGTLGSCHVSYKESTDPNVKPEITALITGCT